jgi:hypothetical protein
LDDAELSPGVSRALLGPTQFMSNRVGCVHLVVAPDLDGMLGLYCEVAVRLWEWIAG